MCRAKLVSPKQSVHEHEGIEELKQTASSLCLSFQHEFQIFTLLNY